MKQIISYGLNVILIMLTVWLLFDCNGEQQARKAEKAIYEQEMKDAQEEIDYAWANYDSCVESKKGTTIEYDTVEKYLGYKYIPKELTLEDSLTIHNIFAVTTSGETIEMKRDSLSDVFVTEDFSLPWEVVFTGRLYELRFPSYDLFEEKIVERYVINNPAPPIDPVIEYKYRSRLYLVAMAGNNFDQGFYWNSIGGKIMWVHKGGVTLGAGYEGIKLPQPNGEVITDGLFKIDFGYRITK